MMKHEIYKLLFFSCLKYTTTFFEYIYEVFVHQTNIS